ncbi:hypothetical protein M1B72_12415 [Geomonas paludis]|uniref:Lipoprotein n=1 Tax=Geomonas paludis TaxID=2740185 RepID=A0A6V8MWM0_9BACT|nr:hypothetical protein [Geomonas paludis]UPU34252.1 hypothetical protein M1B72_12415 [Geomonas paludis]GFO64234.1 hypothetical protein GMPD_21530 [Geomonas paludis]
MHIHRRTEAGRAVALLLACTLLAGCMHHPKNPPAPGLTYYRALGSLQCTGGGKSVAELEQELRKAGLTVTRSACGVDGRVHAAVCGAPDGRIAIFEIPPGQAQAAASLGLQPLATLPDAAEAPCREP